MSNPFDIDALIAQVYRMESIATSSQTFNEDDVIEFLNMELQSTVTPVIQSVNEEYGVMSLDVATSPLPATVRIPSFATGARLRSVQLVSDQGFIRNLPRLDPDKLGHTNLFSQGFYIKNNELVFYPTVPSFQGTLRLNYFRRAGKLVKSLSTARIQLIAGPFTTQGIIPGIGEFTEYWSITINNNPTPSWGTPVASPVNPNDPFDITAPTRLDFITPNSPFDVIARNVVAAAYGNSNLVLVPVLPGSDFDGSKISIGDYVALAGESPVAQAIPAEATYYLCQLAGARCLQALGDTEGYQVAMSKAEQMRMHLLNLISDRIDGQPKRLIAAGMGRRRRTNTDWGQ